MSTLSISKVSSTNQSTIQPKASQDQKDASSDFTALMGKSDKAIQNPKMISSIAGETLIASSEGMSEKTIKEGKGSIDTGKDFIDSLKSALVILDKASQKEASSKGTLIEKSTSGINNANIIDGIVAKDPKSELDKAVEEVVTLVDNASIEDINEVIGLGIIPIEALKENGQLNVKEISLLQQAATPAQLASTGNIAFGATGLGSFAASDFSIPQHYNVHIADYLNESSISTKGSVQNSIPIDSADWGDSMSDIIKAKMAEAGQFEVIIHPRHLGPIKILIEEAEGKNKINIQAKDSYVASLIRDHLPNIQMKLDNSGENVDEVSVLNGFSDFHNDQSDSSDSNSDELQSGADPLAGHSNGATLESALKEGLAADKSGILA